ncbi:D-serine ammonia-lyase [Luteibacter yeojuensis]|nr:D-serine ammonia-lyase [Luteibacter yeojuensis]
MQTLDTAPKLWLNPQPQIPQTILATHAAVDEADARLLRFAPLLAELFEDTRDTAGIIESPLLRAPAMQRAFHDGGGKGSLWIKADHALPVAGSIKARGGVHEVLEIAENLALAHDLIARDSDYRDLLEPRARELFSQHRIVVGSTGNLGMSIGIMASALGFHATVHMSSDAKPWKKKRLRDRGVEVIENDGDYGLAVAAGRKRAAEDGRAFFIDDEHSLPLFYGYAVAARRLARQCEMQRIAVDAGHPLFVYLPCGVGGAPSGITFGLKQVYGEHVHCFFVEPTESPCFLAQMQAPPDTLRSVYDLGMSNRTEADGLAVAQASLLAVAEMRSRLAGVVTTSDAAMFEDLATVFHLEGHVIEPSAAAGFSGLRALFGTDEGARYLGANGLQDKMADATHIVWTTGGRFLPPDEHVRFLDTAAGQRAFNGATAGAVSY